MWQTGRVIERIDWNDKLFSLRIKADIGGFIAGQFIKLSLVIDGERIGRAYSLVNPPGKDYIEVLLVAVDDGKLSGHLQALERGDEVDISTSAAGFMTLAELPKHDSQQLWLLATGTAIGPFISMLMTAEPWQRFDKVIVVYGVRQVADLAYQAKLNTLQDQHPLQLRLILSVTREPFADAISERIPAALASGEIEARAGVRIAAANSQVMLCGNPQMILAVTEVLKARGLVKNLRSAPGQITVEKYW